MSLWKKKTPVSASVSDDPTAAASVGTAADAAVFQSADAILTYVACLAFNFILSYRESLDPGEPFIWLVRRNHAGNGTFVV